MLLVLPNRAGLHRVGGFATMTVVLAAGAVLLVRTSGGALPVLRVGGWPGPIAISLAADALSALLVTVTALVVLCCLVAAVGSGDDRRPYFLPLVLVLTAGADGAFLTTDLFNLFVLVEVMLVPSYVLVGLAGGAGRGGAGRVYVATNLLGSTLLLAGVALVYGTTGVVGLGDLAGVARAQPATAVACGVVLLAFGLKSALVPLHDWLPRTYPVVSPVVVALFSGLLTKVGIYAVIRIYAVVYDGDPGFRWLLGVVAMLSMVVGVLGAVGENSMRRILTFHMVSQLGYVLLGLALFTTAALAAAVYYLAQYILVKAALLLCAAAVRAGRGTDRLDGCGGLAGQRPMLALAFAGAALALAGLPPFSGFVAKFLLLRATAESGAWLAMTVAVLVSLVTLLSMLKIWSALFTGDPSASPTVAQRIGPTLVGPPLVLVGLSLMAGLAAAPLLAVADTAAAGLRDPAGYVRAVTGR
ncbi:monovalent cation/H+ antiporter subunit D family protein [Micromonospora sp. HNM0581]|nr:proton-conducting transporter membrane subunit [Micromonospora sp. HNM0581]NLU77488.1 monovalent cation/H+ antiporter subunit D family protein [Micromonospora sp. HNM0581]